MRQALAFFMAWGFLLLAACAPPIPIPDDPEIDAAREACAQWEKGDAEYTDCIIDQAVAALNPNICRLTSIFIDDLCLQMVYEAAEDDSICDRLYLESVRPNCYDFYAQPERDRLPPALGQIAYVLDGDVYIKRLPDGAAQRLTEDGVNAEPRWSPSGQWLAFRKLESQVWLWSLAGQQATAVEGGAPVNEYVWSGTGERLVAAIGSGVVHLRVLDAATGESSILLPPDADGFPHQISWDPTGTRLAYIWSGYDESAKTMFDELRIMPAGGGDSTVLFSIDVMNEGSLHLAGWQGDRLLFWVGARPIDSFIPDTVTLLSLAADGSEREPRVEQEGLSWMHSRFLAPGVYTVGDGPDWRNKRIWMDGAPRTPADQVAVHPALSPDGRWLAYSGATDPGEIGPEEGAQALAGRRIWLVSAEGEAEPRPLTADPVYRDEYPRWSGDGSHILFARLDAENRASLWLIPAGGGEPDLIVDSLSPISSWHGLAAQVDWAQILDWHR